MSCQKPTLGNCIFFPSNGLSSIICQPQTDKSSFQTDKPLLYLPPQWQQVLSMKSQMRLKCLEIRDDAGTAHSITIYALLLMVV